MIDHSVKQSSQEVVTPVSNFSYVACNLAKIDSLQFEYLVFLLKNLMFKFHFVGAIAVCCLCSTVQAQVFHGRVDRVIDGDTIVVITEDDSIRVRIRGIDAPESNQEFGGESRVALEDLLTGRTVVLKSDQKDKYGRTLASVAVSGTDVGLYMIENGYAWFYEAYGLQIPVDWQKAYKMAQADAKALQLGLWQAPGAVPPWTWRKQKREADKVTEQEHRDSLNVELLPHSNNHYSRKRQDNAHLKRNINVEVDFNFTIEA